MRLFNVAATGLALLLGPSAVARAQSPDLILTNGKIVTVDDRFSIAQALAIRGQRIVKVGSTAEIESAKRSRDANRSTLMVAPSYRV